jgi:hypothetical protein
LVERKPLLMRGAEGSTVLKHARVLQRARSTRRRRSGGEQW